MTQEQKELLTYIHYTLEMNVNDKSKTYEHSIEEDGKVTTLEVDREQHLEEIMRWASQELEKQFKLIPEPKID
ncbi:type II toxin-antitoxin system antitoxin TscA [Staphylococcus hominis]|uniref:type II toxin-antitoxin system antitoxin TscA n=1 Tax=Staphylococcus hominis TaxID=1290 RepID=UPI0034CD86B9